MRSPILTILPIVSLGTLLLTVGCDQAAAPRKLQSYEPAKRCGGVERPWFNVRNAPIADVFIRNNIKISKTGALSWNGHPINERTLRDYALQLSRMSPPPELDLSIENAAPCTVTHAVRQALSSYCSSATCIEFSTDEWVKYSERFVVHATPPQN